MKRFLWSGSCTVSMICMSSEVPRVTVTRACVSPRVKSAEPWVRGSTPTSHVMVADLVEAPAVVAMVVLQDLAAHDLLAQAVVDGPDHARFSGSVSGMRARNAVFTSFIAA